MITFKGRATGATKSGVDYPSEGCGRNLSRDWNSYGVMESCFPESRNLHAFLWHSWTCRADFILFSAHCHPVRQVRLDQNHGATF